MYLSRSKYRFSKSENLYIFLTGIIIPTFDQYDSLDGLQNDGVLTLSKYQRRVIIFWHNTDRSIFENSLVDSTPMSLVVRLRARVAAPRAARMVAYTLL